MGPENSSVGVSRGGLRCRRSDCPSSLILTGPAVFTRTSSPHRILRRGRRVPRRAGGTPALPALRLARPGDGAPVLRGGGSVKLGRRCAPVLIGCASPADALWFPTEDEMP